MNTTKTIGLDAILKEHFTSKDRCRPALTKLHRDEDVVVATDSHVLAVCPINYIDELPGFVEKFPSYKRVIPIHDANLIDFQLSVSEVKKLVDVIPISPLYAECDECDGSGTYHCQHCDQDSECTSCYGSGQTKNVIGNTRDRQKYRFKLKDNFFAPNYINSLLSVALALGEKKLNAVSFGSGESAKVFYCKEVMMLIMPLVYTDEEFEGETIEIPIC